MADLPMLLLKFVEQGCLMPNVLEHESSSVKNGSMSVYSDLHWQSCYFKNNMKNY